MSKKKKKKALETIHDIIERKANRPTLDQTHTRRTFHVENRLLKELDELADKSPASGFQKEFVNHAIRKVLREYYGWDM
jgi:hypothetical protein